MVERPISDWVAEYLPYLRRVARRVAYTYRLSDGEVPDLYQELCLALWKAGPDRLVNATWIFHTANHLAIEILKRKRRVDRLSAAVGAETAEVRASGKPETALLVHAKADRLPPHLHWFYELRFEQGYTQQELMQITHLTRGSVRKLERMCLRHLAGRGRSSSGRASS
jgi:RNA polymerase sigma factor (sigma-70 family)